MLSVVSGLAVLLQGTGLQVVEKLATKGDPAEPFGSVSGLVEASPGVVIVSDDVAPALYRWEVRTNRVSVFAREGRGPGEVLTPTSSARRPGGGVAVYDPANGGVLLFGRDLQFERKVLTQGGIVSNPKSLAVLHDGSFVIAGGRLRDPRHLHLYDSSGTLRRSHGDPPSDWSRALRESRRQAVRFGPYRPGCSFLREGRCESCCSKAGTSTRGL